MTYDWRPTDQSAEPREMYLARMVGMPIMEAPQFVRPGQVMALQLSEGGPQSLVVYSMFDFDYMIARSKFEKTQAINREVDRLVKRHLGEVIQWLKASGRAL